MTLTTEHSRRPSAGRARRAAVGAVAVALLNAVVVPPSASAHHAEEYTQVLEPGFVVSVQATGTALPTALTFGPDGDLYVADITGAVNRFPAVAGVVSGPPTPVVTGLDYPLGLAFDAAGSLFVSSIDGDNDTGGRPWGMVTRTDFDRAGQPTGTSKVLVDIPNGHAGTSGLAFGPDGALYVANGSATDDGVAGGPPDIAPLSGSVLRLDPRLAVDGPLSALTHRRTAQDPPGVDVVATGLRNPYDLAFAGRDLYLSMNGPETTDPYADDLLFRVDDAPTRSFAEDTAPDFGFPGCLYTHDGLRRPVGHPSPLADLPDEEKGCDGVTPPLASFGLHPSANGLDVAPAGFGAFGGDVFTVMWGSFSGVRGHKIVRTGLDADGSVATAADGGLDVEDFALGGAPIDLVFHEGAMYVADFGTSQILRIAPVQLPPGPGTGPVPLPALPAVPDPGPVPAPPSGPLPDDGPTPPRPTALGIPFGPATGFGTPLVVSPAGTGLDFLNLDFERHNVESTDTDADGRPLFLSPVTSLGDRVPVRGVEDLAAGRYDFLCSIHPNMTGTLVVAGPDLHERAAVPGPLRGTVPTR